MHSLLALLLFPFVGVLAGGFGETAYFVFNIDVEGKGEG
jgi:hypothetical protein